MKKIRLLLACLMLCSCHEYALLNFKNSSKDTLYVAISRSTIEHADEITLNRSNRKEACTMEILPGKIDYQTQLGSNGWVRFVEHSEDHTMRIYLINKKDFDNNSWEDISQKKLYKKIEYSLKELEAINWNISIK